MSKEKMSLPLQRLEIFRLWGMGLNSREIAETMSCRRGMPETAGAVQKIVLDILNTYKGSLKSLLSLARALASPFPFLSDRDLAILDAWMHELPLAPEEEEEEVGSANQP
jgi:hypothetical protein